MLFVTAGSGITPVIAMLRTLDRRGTMPDVVLVHSAPDEADVLFREELHGLAETLRGVHARRAAHRRATAG